ncbi:hypothetical protein [Mycobacterium sp. AZCC_0083]|uniref:hypothetical protein n=1 Tax=Mycobacterium sp. AZCC_0083 TaxID=2735882 RepID=UPI001607DDD8|nr:hypothetical protein [Mycobacterium sp. AZCC_0083]MBB5163588.1 hypothetical protein [Mycobacterium sp. AZCC_0083]
MRRFVEAPGRLFAGVLACTFIGVSVAAPAAGIPSTGPYPDIAKYQPVSNIFNYIVTDRDGIWFTTPEGVYCAIEDDGSYGCSGDLPGAPPGENEVAWFVGDPFPRLYHTDEPRFNSGTRQTILIGETYLDYRGSRCAVNRESAVYCIRGGDPNSQLMVSTTMTWRGSDATSST